MKVYKVKVNGKVYEVELEAVTENNESIKAAAPAAAAAPVSSGSNSILAPIAGKVIDVKVNVGDTVKKGQTVAIIEAMKLMNEITAPCDGIIETIDAENGQMVEFHQVLMRIS